MLLRLPVVGPPPAPPMRDRGWVMEPMRPVAAIFGSVYNVRNALSRLGMISINHHAYIGLVHAQLSSFCQRQ